MVVAPLDMRREGVLAVPDDNVDVPFQQAGDLIEVFCATGGE